MAMLVKGLPIKGERQVSGKVLVIDRENIERKVIDVTVEKLTVNDNKRQKFASDFLEVDKKSWEIC